MRIEVTSAGLVLTKALRGEVRRRVLLTMSRFGPEVHGVTARVAEAPNPLGGIDRRCRVRARLQSGLVVGAEAINGHIATAVGRSAARLALLVAAALHDGANRWGLTTRPERPAATGGSARQTRAAAACLRPSPRSTFAPRSPARQSRIRR